MANGKDHAAAANAVIIAGAITAATAIGAGVISAPVAVLLVSGLVIGKYANPDVRDLEHINKHVDHLMHRRFGVLVWLFWRAVWYPLAWLIPHRHWTSHLPPPATIIAWLWLFWLPLGVWLAIAPDTFDIAVVVALLTLPGWALQDVVHLAQDNWKVKW